VSDPTSGEAKQQRAMAMDVDKIREWFGIPAANLDDAQVAVLRFFLEHHPDAFGAIDGTWVREENQ